ncbi:MAG: hypothetical protein PHQ26_06585 [Bacteroidales bacterium]|nr:hypothetical protein [Bacteroidales bacterium]MDD4771125.1 hypothetical protein [Bacteroidales bacterium]
MNQEKYFVSVGEPWDFESKDGQNIVRGEVLGVKSNQCLIFKANHSLKFDSVESDILILTPRHQGNDFSDLPNELVVVNGSLLLKDYDETLNEKELREKAKFVLIGSIKKE